MDPITLLLGLGASLLVGGSLFEEVREAREDDRVLVRTVAKGEDWEATELCSRQALLDVGQLFDLALLPWEADCRSGAYKAIVLAQFSGGSARHLVLRARRDGARWVLDAAFGPGGAMASDDQVALAERALAQIPGSVSSADLSLGRAPIVYEDVPYFDEAPVMRALPVGDPEIVEEDLEEEVVPVVVPEQEMLEAYEGRRGSRSRRR